jgi:hypothetical protein
MGGTKAPKQRVGHDHALLGAISKVSVSKAQ